MGLNRDTIEHVRVLTESVDLLAKSLDNQPSAHLFLGFFHDISNRLARIEDKLAIRQEVPQKVDLQPAEQGDCFLVHGTDLTGQPVEDIHGAPEHGALGEELATDQVEAQQ